MPPAAPQTNTAAQSMVTISIELLLPKIIVIAHQAQAGDARQDHRDQHQGAGALFESAAHFLDGEDDTRQRRVEGRGDARRRARQIRPRALPIPPHLPHFSMIAAPT